MAKPAMTASEAVDRAVDRIARRAVVDRDRLQIECRTMTLVTSLGKTAVPLMLAIRVVEAGGVKHVFVWT